MLRTRIFAAATAAILMLGMSVGGASAALAVPGNGGGPPEDTGVKVFVCKYVGTPGVDEQLQTGNNPISVSVNAIPDYQGVGSYFADKQGRSYVLSEDTRTGGGQEGEPDVTECPGPEVPPPPPEPTTNFEVGLYLYKKLDETKPASWPNSGLQTLIDSQAGTEWFTEFPGDLPTGVCGPGWAVQQDKVSYTGSFSWPTNIQYPNDNIGWPPIYSAKHDDLEEYIDVPDCEPPTLPDITVTASFVNLGCSQRPGSFTVALGLAETNGDKLAWTTSASGNPTLPGTVSVSTPGEITVTVDVRDEYAGQYGVSDDSGQGVLDPVTGAITFTFTFTEAVDCPPVVVTVPEVTAVDECIVDQRVELDLTPAAAPVASFTVTASPNVSYTYTVNGGAPIAIVFPDSENTVTIVVSPGDLVVVTAAAADPYSLPDGYEPWEKSFSESAACIELPPLANWPVSASATDEVCTPAGSLTSGSITVVFPVGPSENPSPVRYFIAFGTPQQQELTNPVTPVAPGAYVVTAIPRISSDSVGDGGQQVDIPVAVGAWTGDDCELDTLAFTGVGAVTNWLGVLAVLLTVAGMGFVVRRHRVEV